MPRQEHSPGNGPAALLEVPEKVRQAAAVLGAWLEQQKRARGRDLKAWSTAQDGVSRADLLMDDLESGDFPQNRVVHNVQELDSAFQCGRAAVSRLFDRERELFALLRPDLPQDEQTSLAAALLRLWTDERPVKSAKRPHRRKPMPKPDADLPARMTDPAAVARTLTQMLADIKRSPESYDEGRRAEDLLACYVLIQDAVRCVNEPR